MKQIRIFTADSSSGRQKLDEKVNEFLGLLPESKVEPKLTYLQSGSDNYHLLTVIVEYWKP